VTQVDALFEEFVTRWTRAEPIDVGGLLARAGSETEQLAHLIDTFLERAPRREPSDESRAAVAAMAARLEREPPLLSARVAARRRVRDVASSIVSACALPDSAEPLVRSHYQRLEGGLLDPRRVSDQVWSVLERLLGPAVRAQAHAGFSAKRVGFAEPLAFQRLARVDASAPAAAAPARTSDELSLEVRRQVEELFTGHGGEQ
jgi:hypothetical protein